jgi:glycosyl transferase family 25
MTSTATSECRRDTQSMHTQTSIRVISLADAHARRDALTERLAGTGLEWSFFDAHRHPVVSYCKRDAWIAKGRPLVPQELGCYSSHYSVWKEFLAGTSTQLLVLEDDVSGDWDYIKKDVLSFDFGSMGIHLLRLYAGGPTRCKQLRVEPERCGKLRGRRIFQLLGYVEGALAYILSRQGAERLLEHCVKIERPVDDEMDRSWIHGVHSFALIPYPVMELQVPSQILGRDSSSGKNPYQMERYRYEIEDKGRRLAYVLKERIWRRSFRPVMFLTRDVPRPDGRGLSPASLLLRKDLTSPARSSSTSTPRLPDADRSITA